VRLDYRIRRQSDHASPEFRHHHSPEILELADWLHQFGVTHLAMESTGVYWRPIYELLEGQFTILVVNAQHVHSLPGRKTDVGDAQWLGDLLRHGLLKPSFVPPRPQRELRELVRHRRNLVQRRSQVINELQQTLELANIKLSSVVSDITGVSATEMLEKLLAGQADPELLAELARGRLRKKKEMLTKALTGRVRDHHRIILAQQLAEIGSLEEDVQAISNEIARRTAEHQELISRLDEIPGINRRVAEIILAEMGTHPEVFGNDPKRAMAWAGVCPGNNESGGKRRVSPGAFEATAT
jgi:transposase